MPSNKKRPVGQAGGAFGQGEGRWTHSLGGERLDISEEMANPPPLRNPINFGHYGERDSLVNHEFPFETMFSRTLQNQWVLSASEKLLEVS